MIPHFYHPGGRMVHSGDPGGENTRPPPAPRAWPVATMGAPREARAELIRQTTRMLGQNAPAGWLHGAN